MGSVVNVGYCTRRLSIFEALRALDDRDEPRSLRFAGGLPLWPFVRWSAFSAAQDRALGLQPAFSTRTSLRHRLEMAVRSQLEPPPARPFEIVIVGSSAGLVVQRAGRWLDRINDYFAMEMPERTLVLDKAAPTGYRRPRVPPHVRCYDTFDVRAGVLARTRRPAAADLAAIDRLIAFVRERFPVAIDPGPVRAQLEHWAVRLPILHDAFARFFERVRPRVLIVEDGSYGGFSHVLAWARAAGIATAELQHGVISRSHLAYNVGDGFAHCLPQYLLAYGDLWRDQIRSPSQVVVVGCPHFSESARPARPSSTVLVISQGTRTEAMVRLAAAVAARFPDRRCVFRLHPGEVAFRDRYAPLVGVPNVEISDRGDLYDLLHHAGIVVGHSSTALVEAAGLGLPVCVLDDESSRAFLPGRLGTWFRTADELLSLVASPPVVPAEPAQFFAPDWRERYRRFVSHVILGA